MQNTTETIHSNKIIIEKNSNTLNYSKNFFPIIYQPTVEDKLSFLIDELKEEYGFEWKNYLKKISLPELEDWEIKELDLFLKKPIHLKKEKIDFKCDISITDIYNNSNKGPFYLKGSALTFFLIYYLHKKYLERKDEQSRGSYLMRYLNSIVSEKKQCSLLKMFDKEEIDTLAERSSPSDMDFFSMEEFLGDQTDKVIQFIASKIPSSEWSPTKIKSSIPKNIIFPIEPESLKQLFFEKLGLRNFCKPQSFHLISFGNDTNGKFFDLVFTAKASEYSQKQKNTLFIQGGLRICINQLFDEKQSELQPMKPEVASNDSFSDSEVFLADLIKELELVGKISDGLEFLIAAVKMVKGYSFSDKNCFNQMLPESSKQFLGKISEKQWYECIKKEMYNHLNNEPIKSLFFLYHISWIAEECFETLNLSLALESLLTLWNASHFPDKWVCALFHLFKAKLPFKLMHSWIQIVILYALEQKKEDLFFRFKQHQKTTAVQIPLKMMESDKENSYFLLIPINFEEAIIQVKQVLKMPEEAFLLLESLTSITQQKNEKPTLTTIQLLSIPPHPQPQRPIIKFLPLIKIEPRRKIIINKPTKNYSKNHTSPQNKIEKISKDIQKQPLKISSPSTRRIITVEKKIKLSLSFQKIEPQQKQDYDILSPIKKIITIRSLNDKEILDPSNSSTSKRILEIFDLKDNSIQFNWIDRKLSEHIKNQLLTPCCDLFCKIGKHPLTKNLLAIDLLINAIFKAGIDSSNYHKLILLITTLRINNKQYWIETVNALVKGEMNDLLKDFLEMIHRNSELKTFFYKIENNVWTMIIDYFIEKNLSPQILFGSGFDLSLATPLLKTTLLPKIYLKQFFYKSGLIKNGEEKKLEELLSLKNQKYFELLDAESSKKIDLTIIDHCRNAATEKSLNRALSILIELIVTTPEDELNFSHRLFSLVITLVQNKIILGEETKISLSKTISCLYQSQKLPPLTSISLLQLNTYYLTEKQNEGVEMLKINLLTKEPLKFLLKKIDHNTGAIFAQSIAKAIVWSFTNPVKNFDPCKELKKIILAELAYEKFFPLGISICLELHKEITRTDKNRSEPITLQCFHKLVDLILLFLEKKYLPHQLPQIFEDLLFYEYKISQEDAKENLKKIYLLGTKYQVFDKNAKKQTLLHAAYENIFESSGSLEDQKQAEYFFNQLYSPCHIIKSHRLLKFLKKNSQIIPAQKLAQWYKLFLQKIQSIDIVKRTKCHTEIVDHVKKLRSSKSFPDFIKIFALDFMNFQYKIYEAIELLDVNKSVLFHLETMSRNTAAVVDMALAALTNNESALFPLIKCYQKSLGNELGYVISQESKKAKQIDFNFESWIKIADDYVNTVLPLKISLKKKHLLLQTWISTLIEIKSNNLIYQKEINRIMIKLTILGVYKNDKKLENQHSSLLLIKYVKAKKSNKKLLNNTPNNTNNNHGNYSFPISFSFLLTFGKMISFFCWKLFSWKKK